ncbi:MAG: hypothetical protein Q9166_002408 [cf. Caloplaca sp. 2 TL-2023]
MLDATVLAPMKGLPEHYGNSDVTPVFIVQANFIPGGLILCFAGMHSAMDATGLGQVVKMFATLCRGEAISAEDLNIANVDRAQLPVTLQPGQARMEHPEVGKKIEEAHTVESTEEPASIWSYFNVPASKLVELKAEGSKDLTSTVPWVSTNDAVTAWLWKAVIKARWSYIDREKETLLLRAASARKVLNPPIPSYIGNVVAYAFHKVAVKTLAEEPLSTTTRAVRHATNRIDDHFIRSFAALIGAEPDKNKLAFGFDAPDRVFMVSSHATIPAYEDFGDALSTPEFVRRPTSSPWTGKCYIMPQRPDGSLDLLVCIREDDMLRLRNDDQFAAFAEYIG